MIELYKNTIVQVVIKVMIPFIQLFAVYVVVHGHSGPGGGFQGGVLLAISIMLSRLCWGRKVSCRRFSSQWAIALATIGILIYMLAGLIPMATGGMFLDYGHLPVPGISGAALRSLGIMIVETGIALAVFGSLVVLFDNVSEGNW